MANNFTKQALQSIKSVGSVAPSSKFLVDDMLGVIDFTKDLTIVELGSGQGAFTLPIAERMTEDSKLIAFELNDEFFMHTKSKLSKFSNVQILQKSAFDIATFLSAQNIDKIDFVVSSLPLALFKKIEVNNLLSSCNKFLGPHGKFLQYQYSLNSYKLLKKHFNHVNLSFTLFNLPPAIIYTCCDTK